MNFFENEGWELLTNLSNSKNTFIHSFKAIEPLNSLNLDSFLLA